MGIVYSIVNKETGKQYVGSSMEPRRRRWNHFNRLKRGTHKNRFLQKDYDKYGKESFEWVVLESGFETVDELTSCEKEYLDRMWGDLYNISKYPYNNWNNRKHTMKTRKLMSEVAKERDHHMRGKSPSKEYRKKIREGHYNNKENLKRVRKFSPDQVREIRRLYAETDIGAGRIANQYGVSKPTIQRIIKRQRYKNVD